MDAMTRIGIASLAGMSICRAVLICAGRHGPCCTRGHLLQPLAGVVEHLDLERLDVLAQHVVDLAGGHLLALLDEADLLHRRQQIVVVLVQRVAHASGRVRSGMPPGSGATAPKSMTPILSSGSSMKFPGCASPCIISSRRGRVVGELERAGCPSGRAAPAVPSRMICDIGMPSIHSAIDHLGRAGHDVRARRSADRPRRPWRTRAGCRPRAGSRVPSRCARSARRRRPARRRRGRAA